MSCRTTGWVAVSGTPASARSEGSDDAGTTAPVRCGAGCRLAARRVDPRSRGGAGRESAADVRARGAWRGVLWAGLWCAATPQRCVGSGVIRRGASDDNDNVEFVIDTSIATGHSHARSGSIPKATARSRRASKDNTNAQPANTIVMASAHQ